MVKGKEWYSFWNARAFKRRRYVFRISIDYILELLARFARSPITENYLHVILCNSHLENIICWLSVQLFFVIVVESREGKLQYLDKLYQTFLFAILQ